MESNRNRLYHSLGPVTRVPRNGYRSHMKASRYNSPASGDIELPSGVGGWLIWVLSDIFSLLSRLIGFKTKQIAHENFLPKIYYSLNLNYSF